MATSEIETITADLEQALNAIAQAQHQAMATAEHAGQTASRAAATGLHGVGVAISGIRNQIKAIHEVIASAASLGQAAGLAVRQVSDQMSPHEANAHFTTSVAKIEAMREALFAAAQQVNTAKGRVESALRGGQPGPILVRLDGVRQYLAMAAQQGDTAKSRINATIAKTGQLGN
ncbi:MAG: hypothetical protein HKP61_15690 [Dactylosporangium sp.]|nr:hypothetical protein [Dactylosporangium sp.]NNJ62348.1 hypothetical protein [Dactylosporangium sp.]